MTNWNISTKILTAFLSVAIIAIGLIGYFSFTIGRSNLEDESFNKLTAVREMKASQIEDYFNFIRNQIITLSEDRMTIEAMGVFDEGFHLLPEEVELDNSDIALLEDYYTEEFVPRLTNNYPSHSSDPQSYWSEDLETSIIQHLYISSNPYSTGSKHFLSNPGDGSSYSQAHDLYHPVYKEYLEHFGYYDIFLVDANSGGHIVYSVFKEVDFGTSLIDGPYKNTNIAKIYLAALELDDENTTAIVDFDAYSPSYGEPAAFIASPIFDGEEKIGVLIFQLPVDKINAIMTSNQNWSAVGLGDSGETYIVGDDFTLRNQSRFLIEDSENYFQLIRDIDLPSTTINRIQTLNSTIKLQNVRTQGTEAALNGQSGIEIFPDYRGISVLSAYKPLNINGLNWVIMSEIDETEAFQSIQQLANSTLLAVIGLMATIALVALVFARTLTKPIQLLTETANKLAEGNLDAPIEFTDQKDEIGKLASSFDVMRLSMKDLITNLEEANQNLEQKVEERTKDLELSERKTRSIVDTASDGIVVMDKDSNVLQWNLAAEKMFGYTAEEITNQTIDRVMPERFNTQHYHAVKKASETGNLAHPGTAHELAGIRKDGSEFPIELSLSHWKIGEETFFSGIIRDITERKELERQIEEANKRMSAELNFAREIQMSMLPLIFPAFPTRTEFSIYAKLIQAREVGGDFYDFFFVDEDHLCFVIGDVSGKGAAGALLMAVSKTLIKSRAADDFQPSSILTHVNDELSRDNTTSMFVTVFLGIINIHTGHVEYTNAGHNPPFIKRADGSLEKIDAFHGPVIGAMPNLTYKQDSLVLGKDDIIVLYTDGVTESMNEAEELFTEERYEKLIKSGDINTAQKLIDNTVMEVKRHEGEAEQADDITALALQFSGASDVEERGRLDIEIKNQITEMALVEERFELFATQQNIPDEARQKVSIVLDELLNNIISYAYQDEEDHTIRIQFVLTGNRLAVTIRDDGVPFNPFGLEPPATNLTMDERDVGGLGIHLVRSMMDEYMYLRQIGKNVVTLAKLIDK